jgi:SNF2 family DNA or RNA helicase
MAKNPDTRLWLMTGTPTPNDPTDAWTLSQLVESPYATRTYTAFREQVMMKVGQWKFVPRPESVDIVKTILQPAIRYTRDECFDLPDTVIQTRKVDLTPQQKQHYTTMMKRLVIEMQAEGTSISAVNEAVKVQKLVQIACGVAYTDDGQDFEVDCTPRINAVKEVIEEAGEKVIVFVPLTGTLNMLERDLSKRWSVGVVNGAVSSKKRNEIFHNFQHSRDPHLDTADACCTPCALGIRNPQTIGIANP